MSKNLRTAADARQVREGIERVLAECDNEDCVFCDTLRQVLEAVANPTPLHLE